MNKPIVIDPRFMPTNPGSLQMFAQGIRDYLRSGDAAYLPPGVAPYRAQKDRRA